MTHIIPSHQDPNNIQNRSVPSISSALAMDQQQHDQQMQQHDGQMDNGASTTTRKRKKAVPDGEEGSSISEPRRLRRSHEACARCRSKKIKCDSKHPRCSACATAGVQCNQEDRHRKTLTPRDHVEKIERQILQCQALLRRQYPNFTVDDLDNILRREGVEIDPQFNDVAEAFHFSPPGSSRSIGSPGGPDAPLQAMPPPPPKGYPYGPPPPHMIPHPGYPPVGMPPPGFPPPGAPYPPMPMPGGMYNPHIHPAFQHPHMAPPGLSQLREYDIKGQDPSNNDMSNTQALAKNFGVSAQIVNDLKLNVAQVAPELEDLAVGAGGLSSGRDREFTETFKPSDPSLWTLIHMPTNRSYVTSLQTRNVPVWLPKDRGMAKHIVHAYFKNLNPHRPVLIRHEFEAALDALYDGKPVTHDPGFVCSLYLVFALGTMGELNKAAGNIKEDPSRSPTTKKKLLPAGWPEYDEFFNRALAVKPDLRVTISSLQALILLHWFLYTERQSRSLWRLVGSLVRVAIELGLHHDPFSQVNTFTEEESQLRIRLWSIVMIHDRGTSILLGRPLAISPADSNTPRPARSKDGRLDFSEHFFFSAPVAEIQADIVNSLYSPTRQGQETIMRHATRIIKSMVEFRKQLPEPYKYYFGGTEDWPVEKRRQLVEDISEDQGLTLLKVGIARILLLRALFSSKELPYSQRHRALMDAIVAAHNVIVVHYQLIRFPDIAFFVSPVPIHIAAMVILYGQMSKCDRLTRDEAIEDIWTALDMLPRFRWRWERKDVGGGHPLIEKLAERVLEINLSEVKRTGQPVLIPEEDWEASSPSSLSPIVGPHHAPMSSPTHMHGPFSQHGGPYGPGGELNGKTLADVPPSWFWPMDPDHSPALPVGVGPIPMHSGQQVAPPYYPPIGTIGCVQSAEAFVLEEKDPSLSKQQMQTYLNSMEGDQWRMQGPPPSRE